MANTASPTLGELRQQETEQAKADRKADRQRHLAAVAQLEKQALAELPALLAGRNLAEQGRTAALEYVKTAQAKFNQAFSVHQSRSTYFSAEIDRHRMALEATADGVIDWYLEKLAAEILRLRQLPAETTQETSKSIRTFGELITRTNRPSIIARLAACIKAREAVQELKCSDLDGEPLKNRLAEVWVGLPEITEPK